MVAKAAAARSDSYTTETVVRVRHAQPDPLARTVNSNMVAISSKRFLLQAVPTSLDL